MKRVLITGANSYIGDSTKNYLMSNSQEYLVDVLDMLSDWKNFDFSAFDVVLNVAAIVHRPKEKAELYYKINRDMTVELAELARNSGVKQFIQISTTNVFGIDLGVISENSKLKPNSDYGKSKLEADESLLKMNGHGFKVCIVRPPMIYGRGCKGNYVAMEKFALKSPVFPSLRNKKDFIYIDNMCDALGYYIDHDVFGVCYPRDKESSSTCDIVKMIASLNGKNIHLCPIFNLFVKLFLRFSRTLTLVFGDNYCVIDDHTGWTAPFKMEDGLRKMYEK